MLILELRIQKLREVHSILQGCIAGRWWGWESSQSVQGPNHTSMSLTRLSKHAEVFFLGYKHICGTGIFNVSPWLSEKRIDILLKRDVLQKMLGKTHHVDIVVECTYMGFTGGARGKEPACQCRWYKRHDFDPWVGEILWHRKWQPTPVFLPGESSWTEEPGRLWSIVLQRVGLDWSSLACTQVDIKEHEKPGRLMATSTIQALGCISSGEQGSANTCPWAKYVQSPVFIHSVLLKQDHAYLFMAVFMLLGAQSIAATETAWPKQTSKSPTWLFTKFTEPCPWASVLA